MPGTFALIDLQSQAVAVLRHLSGHSADEKLAWLDRRGNLEPVELDIAGRQHYLFESTLGFRCLFFIDGDDLVFFMGEMSWRRASAGGTR